MYPTGFTVYSGVGKLSALRELQILSTPRPQLSMRQDAGIQKAIQNFAVKYGLLWLMTALPITPKFMDCEAVYLPKNPFIKAESMDTME